MDLKFSKRNYTEELYMMRTSWVRYKCIISSTYLKSFQINQAVLCILVASLCLSKLLQEKKPVLRNHGNYSLDSLCKLSGDWSKHCSLLIRMFSQILHSVKEGQAFIQEDEE